METIWFWLVACMLVAYVIFDGFDFRSGIVHFLVARTDAERCVVFSTISPVWDGNEVWLLAAGGQQPHFVAIPHRADGREHHAALGVGARDEKMYDPRTE